jgi:hypothetical protein
MTDVTVQSLGTRLRQVRCDAARRGMFVRKTCNDPNVRRYIFVECDGHSQVLEQLRIPLLVLPR